MGTPWRRLASAMPQRRGAPTDPIVFIQVQNAFQRGLSAFAAPLEREDAHDQQHEDEEECDVEAREHRRVPDRKGGEGRPAGDDEPDLVSVPERPDRLEHRLTVVLIPAQDGEEHPDPEVEALGHEVPGPKEAEEREPDDLEGHSTSTPAPAEARPPRPRVRPREDRAGHSDASGRGRRRREPCTGTRTRPG